MSTNEDSKTLGIMAGSDKFCYGANESVRHLTETSVAPESNPLDDMRFGRVAWRGQRPIVDRFWSKVHKTATCWLWTGCVVARYGQIGLGHPYSAYGKRWKTHRFSWELHHGPIPKGLKVCHRCDVPLCVRPSHLFLGTQAENVHDSSRKGRKNAWGIQKLNADDVLVIRAQSARGISQKDIAKAFGIARSTVSGIVHRKSWGYLE